MEKPNSHIVRNTLYKAYKWSWKMNIQEMQSNLCIKFFNYFSIKMYVNGKDLSINYLCLFLFCLHQLKNPTAD